MQRKKPKVDFAAIRAATKTRITAISSLENEVKSLKEVFREKYPKDPDHLHRFYSSFFFFFYMKFYALCNGYTIAMLISSIPRLQLL